MHFSQQAVLRNGGNLSFWKNLNALTMARNLRNAKNRINRQEIVINGRHITSGLAKRQCNAVYSIYNRTLTLSAVLFLSFCISLSAQNRRFTVSGNITDSATGESLIGASVFVEELRAGTTANVYGFYSLSLPEGTYQLMASFIGYEYFSQIIEFPHDTRVNITLTHQAITRSNILVTA